MLRCFYCRKSFQDAVSLRAHLQQAHSGFWKRPYVCRQNGCLRTFENTYHWKRHVENQHSACVEFITGIIISQVPPEPDENAIDKDVESSSVTESQHRSSISVEELKDSVKKCAIDFVLQVQ